MWVIFLHKHLDCISHAQLSQQLHLLIAQILLYKRPNPNLLQLLADRHIRVVDTQDWLFCVRVLLARGDAFGAVEDEDVARVCDAPLEFLAEANGVGHLGDVSCVDLDEKGLNML